VLKRFAPPRVLASESLWAPLGVASFARELQQHDLAECRLVLGSVLLRVGKRVVRTPTAVSAWVEHSEGGRAWDPWARADHAASRWSVAPRTRDVAESRWRAGRPFPRPELEALYLPGVLLLRHDELPRLAPWRAVVAESLEVGGFTLEELAAAITRFRIRAGRPFRRPPPSELGAALRTLLKRAGETRLLAELNRTAV